MSDRIKSLLRNIAPKVIENATSAENQASQAQNKSQKSQGDQFEKKNSDYLKFRSSSMMTGAFKIFSTDHVHFPPDLLDINNPENDVNYFRLMAAALGMNELERYFYTTEDLRDKRNKERSKKAKESKESLKKDLLEEDTEEEN